MAMPGWRKPFSVLAFAACVGAALIGLDLLARHQLQVQFDRAAADTLGPLLHGQTSHRWSASRSTDIIAGRAFDSESARFDDDGMHVRAADRAFEVGLVLTGLVDLNRYPRFEARFQSPASGTLSLIVAEAPDAPPCRSGETRFDKHATRIRFNLDEIRWDCGDSDIRAPQRAALLRLHVSVPAGSEFILGSADLRPSTPLTLAALDHLALPILPSPRQPYQLDRALGRIASDSSNESVTIVQLPLDGRVEEVLAARDHILDVVPDTVIVAKDGFPRVSALAKAWDANASDRSTSGLSWIWVGLLAVVLLGIRLKPPLGLRSRSSIELCGALAAPVVLIGGGHIGDDISLPVMTAGALTFAYAISLLFGDAPAQPTARTLKRGWWVALASLALAAGLILLANKGHLAIDPPTAQHALRYLAWAAAQQFLICVIVAGRLEKLIGSQPWALLIAALTFALLHTPNAMLMQLTFIGALIWIWNWQRHRALLANIIAHTASGLLLTANLPPHWLHSAEISARYFLIGTP